MTGLFYVSAAVAFLSTLMVVTKMNAVHALLYLIVSLLAVALVFFSLGAPFVAALEVIIYAGAIMVLFVFVIMMLDIGKESAREERKLLEFRVWAVPVILVVVLLAELIYIFAASGERNGVAGVVQPKAVGISLFGPYLIGVELASMLLLAGLVGAYHLGQRGRKTGGNSG